jgi:hypothetical protein
MNIEKFNIAKDLHSKIEKLQHRISQLERSQQTCGIKVTVNYNISKMSTGMTGELYIYDKDSISGMLNKEELKLKEELSLLEKEFKKI